MAAAVTPGRAAVGTLLHWCYWLFYMLFFAPLVVIGTEPIFGDGGMWAGIAVGLLTWAFAAGVYLHYRSRMADRVYREFAAVAREWGVLSGRITAEAGKEQR